jgi:20S proteasome alpha/beta subunit
VRALDGIVLVADRKVIDQNSGQFYFLDKIYEPERGMIIGYAGNRGAFEVFKTRLKLEMDRQSAQLAGNNRSESVLMLISKLVQESSNRFPRDKEGFELIVGQANPAAKSLVTRVYPDGEFIPIDFNESIGTGAPFGLAFFKTAWYTIMSMEDSAELGYFTLLFIEQRNLTNSVGLGQMHPQICYLPDKSDTTVEPTPDELTNMRSRIESKLIAFQDHLRALFPVITKPGHEAIYMDEMQKWNKKRAN